jgi:hypothetical protein
LHEPRQFLANDLLVPAADKGNAGKGVHSFSLGHLRAHAVGGDHLRRFLGGYEDGVNAAFSCGWTDVMVRFVDQDYVDPAVAAFFERKGKSR